MMRRQSEGRAKGQICVIGRGRWGSSLVSALRRVGAGPFVVAGRKALGSSRAQAWIESEIFWLCVPDGAIAQATQDLVRRVRMLNRELQGRIVVHASGVHNRDVLREAAEAGAQTGSVHPLMTFPTRRPVDLTGVPFAVEASGALRPRLFRMVRRIGGKPFGVTSEGKALYHASAVIASPLLVSLATAAQAIAQEAGLTRQEADRVLRPIMEATLQNVFAKGGARSFSGPFARGDEKTISLHLEALRSHPLWEQVYRALGLHALSMLPAENVEQLRNSLTGSGTPSRKGSMGE